MLKNLAKKSILVVFVAMFCFAFFPFQIKGVSAQAQDSYYAKVQSSNVKLYRSTTGSEEFSNVYFVIPQSYFVEISYCENENYYTARYQDVYGYVKKSEVKAISGVPQTPFAIASFRMYIPGGIDLRSTPVYTDGLNTLGTINFMETNLRYYGTIDGEEAVTYSGTTWYYCKYTKGDQEIFGYLYAYFCDLLTEIPTNTEVVEYIEQPDFVVDTTTTPSGEDGMSALPTTTQIIIIVAVCLPCIAITSLLFRPTKIGAKALQDAELKPTKREKRKRSRHQDYYEYDE